MHNISVNDRTESRPIKTRGGNPYTIEMLTEEGLWEVWTNARQRDKEELKHQGHTDENIFRYLDYRTAFQVNMKGKPIAVFGAAPRNNVVYIFFFGTEEVDRKIHKLTKHGIDFIRLTARMYPSKQILVEVWEKHTQSVGWLSQFLNFEKTDMDFVNNGQRFHIMAWKGAKQRLWDYNRSRTK